MLQELRRAKSKINWLIRRVYLPPSVVLPDCQLSSYLTYQCLVYPFFLVYFRFPCSSFLYQVSVLAATIRSRCVLIGFKISNEKELTIQKSEQPITD